MTSIVSETGMEKRVRVLKALAGERPDHVPVSVWMHNFHAEIDHDVFVDEAVRQADAFDWDYLKPQVSAEQFPQMWGLEFHAGEHPSTLPVFTRFPIRHASEFAALRPAPLAGSPLEGQLDALVRIRERVGPRIPIVWTVFSPLVVARTMLEGGQAEFIHMLRENPSAVAKGLEAIAVTLAEYAGEAVRRGADGIFLATTFASRRQITTDERKRHEIPLFDAILARATPAPFNLLHLCGHDIAMSDYGECDVSAYSWADGGDNPSLKEGHSLTGRAVMGGMPAKPAYGSVPLAEMAAGAERACRDMDSRWLLLAPGCSINAGSSDEVLGKAADVTKWLRRKDAS